MEDKPFEALIDETAAGLKVDPEIYLETRRELRSHLQAKADQLEREGHTPEESVDLARKWFGSPMDVAAELLSANRNRMRLRSLVRLGFNAVFIPLVIVAALYVGYGRLARTQAIASQVDLGIGLPTLSGSQEPRLPTIPFFRPPVVPESFNVLSGDPHTRLRYWQTHRSDPKSYVYYTYYVLTLNSSGNPAKDFFPPPFPYQSATAQDYVSALRLGEKLEPGNALYNVLLAKHYLDQGMVATSERPRGELKKDVVIDKTAFKLGVAEWMKAVRKPYLTTHLDDVVGMAMGTLKGARFWEDYNLYQVQTIASTSSTYFPFAAKWRSLARKLPSCARILSASGDKAGAERLVDTWRVLPVLLAKNANSTIDALVSKAVATMLAKEAAKTYKDLAEPQKAAQAQRAFVQLRQQQKSLRARGTTPAAQLIEQRGSVLVAMLGPIFSKSASGTPPEYADPQLLKQELTPGRMAEYAFATNQGLDAFLALLAVLLLGCVIQGYVWLRNLRRASAVPMLLMPPIGIAAKAIGLGVVLPIVTYILYTHIPIIGGRDFGLNYNGMWSRFIAEQIVVAILVLWIPSAIVRGYVRKRCRALAIDMPQPKGETKVAWSLRLSAVAAAGVVATGIMTPSIIEREEAGGIFIAIAAVEALIIVIIAARRAGRARKEHSLYYGTMARSISVVYALTILFITVAVQPLLLRSEVNWLKKDRLMYGYLVDKSLSPASMTYIETQYARAAANDLLRILDGNAREKER